MFGLTPDGNTDTSGMVADKVHGGFTVTVVAHVVVVLLDASVTVHAIVLVPTLKAPLASVPLPLRLVAPVIV